MFDIGFQGLTKRILLLTLNAILALGMNCNDSALLDIVNADNSVNTVKDHDGLDSDDLSTEPTYLLEFDELDLSSIPEYDGEPYCVINDNIPYFTEEDKLNPVFEYYSELDELGRCGVATANLSKELMPTEARGSIGQIKPTGWHTIKYPDLISDLYLFNRCHLIAFSLAGENANERNLITGTRYMNATGMQMFESTVASYVEFAGGRVLYRVTPCFDGDDLVARGVHMEGLSLDDDGERICFNVFLYNVQPGIVIDYATGESHEE